MRVALVLIFVALARSAQASETKRDPAEYFEKDWERAWAREVVGSPGTNDVPAEATPQSAASNRLVEKFASLSGEQDLESAQCSSLLDYKILETLSNEPGDSDDVKTFKSLARSKLEKCAREFDAKFEHGDLYMLEWSFDKFFSKAENANKKKLADEVLLEAAASFDIRPDVYDDDDMCLLAVTLNDIRNFGWAINRFKQIVTGKAKFTWYSRVPIDSVFEYLLEERYGGEANCVMGMKEFFKETCEADSSDSHLGLRLLNFAAAFGADLTSIMSPRTAKYREYQRICYNRERSQNSRLGDKAPDVMVIQI